MIVASKRRIFQSDFENGGYVEYSVDELPIGKFFNATSNYVENAGVYMEISEGSPDIGHRGRIIGYIPDYKFKEIFEVIGP